MILKRDFHQVLSFVEKSKKHKWLMIDACIIKSLLRNNTKYYI